jgi:hypothetical protein
MRCPVATCSSNCHCIDSHRSFYFNLADSCASDIDAYPFAFSHVNATTNALRHATANDHGHADPNSTDKNADHQAALGSGCRCAAGIDLFRY